MGRVALVKNGTVENVIVLDANAPAFEPDDGSQLVALPEDSLVGLGWGRSGDNWTAPPAPAPVATQPVDPVEKLRVFLIANPDVAELVGADPGGATASGG
ncbi:hypothetical protein KTE49_20775 [Burkholderia multivorans]|uniref:hypothetical protein n=1 Tax=Burkholderia multivorans TaxID=87883 RepID=UPI001C265369|nr:hypothetical protein [Burkholderia multivorans]MBU9532871.1 hypothetical protein [Burkholderia multivorans]